MGGSAIEIGVHFLVVYGAQCTANNALIVNPHWGFSAHRVAHVSNQPDRNTYAENRYFQNPADAAPSVGYSHAVSAPGSRLVVTSGQVPLD